MTSRRAFVLGVAGAACTRGARAEQADAWRRLREGRYVVLIRHATTVPGLGDPAGFRLED